MRVLVIVIASLALLGGLGHFAGGILGFFSALLMMTSPFPPEVAQASEMSPLEIGLIFILIGALMVVNGLIFIIFAIGTFKRKRWARFLGIFGYALNIVVFLITMLSSKLTGNDPQYSLLPYIFGTFVAIAFIVILFFSKSAFEKSDLKMA